MSKTTEELLDDIEYAKANRAKARDMVRVALAGETVETAFHLAHVAVVEAERALEDRLVAESYQHDAQVDHPGREG